MDKNTTPTETIETLLVLKRRVYSFALGLGLATLIVTWVFRNSAGTLAPFDRYIFPIYIVWCMGLLIGLLRSRLPLVWIESSLFTMAALGLLARLAEILFSPNSLPNSNILQSYADLLYWFPLVYVLAFLTFKSSRRLLIGSIIFFAATIILGLADRVNDWVSYSQPADTYLLAPFYLANVIYIVLLAAGVRLNESHIRLRTLSEEMTTLAHTDALVQIANRRDLEATIARGASHAARYNQPISLIMFDLDDFKRVNDIYGHEAGDSLLKDIAGVVSGLVRLPDLFGRWGGDEFLVIAPQTNSVQAGQFAERLRRTMAGARLQRIGNITASFGVAEFNPQELREAWLKRADKVLYAAKKAGGNSVVIAEPIIVEGHDAEHQPHERKRIWTGKANNPKSVGN